MDKNIQYSHISFLSYQAFFEMKHHVKHTKIIFSSLQSF